jgi:hypothetical protein
MGLEVGVSTRGGAHAGRGSVQSPECSAEALLHPKSAILTNQAHLASQANLEFCRRQLNWRLHPWQASGTYCTAERSRYSSQKGEG